MAAVDKHCGVLLISQDASSICDGIIDIHCVPKTYCENTVNDKDMLNTAPGWIFSLKWVSPE